MGTTLTGTTPQDTYDSLIKVTDNGPLTGSLKVLTDGLGNDSALALSTGAASVTGTLAVSSGITSTGANTMLSASSSTEGLVVRGGSSIGTPTTTSGQILIGGTGSYRGSIAYDDNAGYLYIDNLYNNNAGNIYFRTKTQGTAVEALTILGSGNVGIGTDAPLAKLQSTTAGSAANEVGLRLNNPNGNVAPTGVDIVFQSGYTTGDDGAAVIRGGRNTAGTDSYITFQTNSGLGLAEVGRWLPTGGLTFNGDTAAANALDDYEEGTFTPVFTTTGTDFTSGGNASTGKYTKIGNLVTVQINAVLSGAVSAGTGNVVITGMPFTAGTAAYGTFSSGRVTISANNYFASIENGTTSVSFSYLNSGALSTTLPASDINGNSTPFISTTITYQV